MLLLGRLALTVLVLAVRNMVYGTVCAHEAATSRLVSGTVGVTALGVGSGLGRRLRLVASDNLAGFG